MPTGHESLPRTIAVIEDGIARKLHTGVQFYASIRGETVASFGVGEARPGVAMDAHTITLWRSAGKPLTAVAIAQLVEREELGFDDPVAEHLPGFDKHGKDAVTIRHLLTHSSGIEEVDPGWPKIGWDESIARVCDAKLKDGVVPGKDAAYSPQATWFVLGEILQRAHTRLFTSILREDICEPLGMTETWNGMPRDVYERLEPRIAYSYTRDGSDLKLIPMHRDDVCMTPSPGANARGPVRELGRFYESLLGHAPQILKPETVAEMTRRQRVGKYDTTFQHTLDFGLGFILNSSRYGADTVPYGYGPYASPGTFGHGGAQSSIAFADPERQLVVAFVANGLPGEPKHQRRARAIAEAIYEDLGT